MLEHGQEEIAFFAHGRTLESLFSYLFGNRSLFFENIDGRNGYSSLTFFAYSPTDKFIFISINSFIKTISFPALKRA